MTGKTGTKEWAKSNVNFLKGCSNNCSYCYAKGNALRFGRINDPAEWETMEVNYAATKKGYGKRSGKIMFPSSHDLFPEHLGHILPMLRKMLAAGNEVIIVTKPRFEVIESICANFEAYKEQILFRFTITSTDDVILAKYEPGAPHFEMRLASLKFAFLSGYETSVSIEPYLSNPLVTYLAVEKFVTETVWVGFMNHGTPAELKSLQREGFVRQLYLALKDYGKVRFKDSMQKKLGIDQYGKKV